MYFKIALSPSARVVPGTGGVDSSNIYSMYMALWGHLSNKAFMYIFGRDGQYNRAGSGSGYR